VVTKPQRKRVHLTLLSFRYRRWLLTGRPGALWYLERERVTALWREYGDLIIARHVARWPFSRPPNWWRLDAPEWLREGETQREYLERHKLLMPSEKRRGMRKASRRQKRAGLAMKINTIDPART
jgi:hypothetical protein